MVPETTTTGRFLRTARLLNEYYETPTDPAAIIEELTSRRPRPAMLSFLSDVEDCHRLPYRYEIDSIAVLPIDTYERWWKKQINAKTRNMVRKAQKSNVEVKSVRFSDDLAAQIKAIYDESPTRQGKKFSHYGKPVGQVKAENATFSQSSDYLGAFWDGKMIGYAKLVHGARKSSLMQIVSMVGQRDKAPTNALVAHAVRICAERQCRYLHYGVWSRRGLGGFKKHNGFKRYNLVRYYVPLTALGYITIALGLHKRISTRIPGPVQDRLVVLRDRLNAVRRLLRRRRTQATSS